MATKAVATVQPNLLAALPTFSSLAREVADLLVSSDAEDRLTHGAFAGIIQRIDPNRIWVNPLLMVFGEQDLEVLGEQGLSYLVLGSDAGNLGGEAIDALLDSYDHRVVRDENGIDRLHLILPLAVIERVHPTIPSRDLMLLVDPLGLLAAKALNWQWVETIILGDMPDYEIRAFGLHIKMRQSAPTKFEIWRQLTAMDSDVEEGRCGPGALSPTKAGLARLLGISRIYANRLENAKERSPLAIAAAMTGRVPIQLALLTAQRLYGYPEVLRSALDRMAAAHMSVSAGTAFLTEVVANETGALALVSDRTPGEQGVRSIIAALTAAQTAFQRKEVQARFTPKQQEEIADTMREYIEFFKSNINVQ